MWGPRLLWDADENEGLNPLSRGKPRQLPLMQSRGAFLLRQKQLHLLIHADEAFEPVDIGFAVDHVGIVDDEQIVDALLGSELLEIE